MNSVNERNTLTLDRVLLAQLRGSLIDLFCDFEVMFSKLKKMKNQEVDHDHDHDHDRDHPSLTADFNGHRCRHMLAPLLHRRRDHRPRTLRC